MESSFKGTIIVELKEEEKSEETDIADQGSIIKLVIIFLLSLLINHQFYYMSMLRRNLFPRLFDLVYLASKLILCFHVST